MIIKKNVKEWSAVFFVISAYLLVPRWWRSVAYVTGIPPPFSFTTNERGSGIFNNGQEVPGFRTAANKRSECDNGWFQTICLQQYFVGLGVNQPHKTLTFSHPFHIYSIPKKDFPSWRRIACLALLDLQELNWGDDLKNTVLLDRHGAENHCRCADSGMGG